MGINTGQITKLARKSCFNWINIFTFLFLIVLQIFFRNSYHTQPLIYSLAYSLYSYYAIFISLQLSKPSYQIQTNRLHGTCTVIVSKIQKQNRIGIGESLISIINLIIRNYKYFILILAIEVALKGGIIYIIQKLMIQQMELIEQLFDKGVDQMKSRGISNPEDYQEIFYFNFLMQIRGIKGKLINKFYSLGMYAFGIQLVNSISFYLLTWLKYCLIATIHKRQQLQQMNIVERNQNGHQISFIQGIKQFWRDFIKFQTITAYFRLFLRLFWIFVFLDLLQPFYYICLGLLYWEAIHTNTKNKIIEKIVQRQIQIQKNKEPGKQTMSQQENVNNEDRDYSQEINKLFSQSPQSQSQLNSKINNKKQDTSQPLQKQKTNKIKNINSFKQIQKVLRNQNNNSKLNPILVKLAKHIRNDLKNKTKVRSKINKNSQKLNNNPKSKIKRLVYRPYFNDVIEVRCF